MASAHCRMKHILSSAMRIYDLIQDHPIGWGYTFWFCDSALFMSHNEIMWDTVGYSDDDASCENGNGKP